MFLSVFCVFLQGRSVWFLVKSLHLSVVSYWVFVYVNLFCGFSVAAIGYFLYMPVCSSQCEAFLILGENLLTYLFRKCTALTKVLRNKKPIVQFVEHLSKLRGSLARAVIHVRVWPLPHFHCVKFCTVLASCWKVFEENTLIASVFSAVSAIFAFKSEVEKD